MHRLPRIPGYQLHKRLGGGLLTDVFAARDCDTDAPCAVKVLRDDWADQATGVKLLQREARRAGGRGGPERKAALKGDFSAAGARLFERRPGGRRSPPGSLDQTFKRHGCDPPADIRRFAGPLPDALVRLLERLLLRHPEKR